MSKRILLVKTDREKLLQLRENLIKANPGCKWSDDAVEVGDVVYILRVISIDKSFMSALTGFDPECVDASDLVEQLDDLLQTLIMMSKKVKDGVIHPEGLVEAKSEILENKTPDDENTATETFPEEDTRTTTIKPKTNKKNHKIVKKNNVISEPETTPEEPKL